MVQPGDPHARANAKSMCVFAQPFDLSDYLMPWNDGRFALRQFSLDDVQIRPAHPAIMNTHEHFTLGRLRRGHIAVNQGICFDPGRFRKYAGFHNRRFAHIARLRCSSAKKGYQVLTPFGASGRPLRRTPVASKTALPMAGAMPSMGVSPAPADGMSFRSIRTASISGTSRKRGTR